MPTLTLLRNCCWWLTTIGLLCSLLTLIALIFSPTLYASGPAVLLKPMGVVLFGYIGLEFCSIMRWFGYGQTAQRLGSTLRRTF